MIADLLWEWRAGWRENPFRTRCGGCGWPISWAWHVTVSGQQCRNCQLKLTA